jgi:lysophospholipase L1-like esterase
MKFLRRTFFAGLVAASLVFGAAAPARAGIGAAISPPSAAVLAAFDAQTFTVHPGNTVLFAGDSLTQFGWMTVPGGLVDQVNVLASGLTSTYHRIAAGHQIKGNGHAVRLQVPGGGAINVINRGVAGWSSNEIFNDKINVVALAPDAIILGIGVNDATLGVSPATYRSNLDATLTYYQANLPGVQILFFAPLLDGELWTHIGPAFSGNGFDPQIDAIIVQAQASCASHSVLFVPLRPAALTYIIANGPPEPGASFGTIVDSSQKHPIVPDGQLWMSNQIMPSVTVAP